VDAFKEWHHLLEGAKHEIIVYSNHKKFQYLMMTRVLNKHQVQWAFTSGNIVACDYYL